MADLTPKAGYGGSNYASIHEKNAGGTGCFTTSLFTFDRSVTTTPAGHPTKKNAVYTFDSKIRNKDLETSVFQAGYLSSEDPVVVETIYENRDKTKTTLSSGGAKQFVLLYYESKNDGWVATHIINGVFSGATGDGSATNPNDINGTSIEISGIEAALTVSVPPAAFNTNLVTTTATETISQYSQGKIVYMTAV